jgi:hypothetical protein
MSKKFDLSEKWFVVVKEDEIRLFEDRSNKWATFSYSRWARFFEQFTEGDESVSKLTAGQQDVKLQLHVGGGWYIRVTSGFYCVDVRKSNYLPGVGVRPKKTGIALCLYIWACLKVVAEEIRRRCPKVAEAQPCFFESLVLISLVRWAAANATPLLTGRLYNGFALLCLFEHSGWNGEGCRGGGARQIIEQYAASIDLYYTIPMALSRSAMLCRPTWKELYTYSATTPAPVMRDLTIRECAKFIARA